jgi:hypothetical protein
MNQEVVEIFKQYDEKNIKETKTTLYKNIIEVKDNSKRFVNSYKSSERKLIYLKVDKCASSSLIECLTTESNFNPIYEIKNFSYYKKNYKSFAVIRDPKSRWISGLNEFMTYMIGDEKTSKDYIEDELKENKFIFDGHTLPQISFLHWHKYVNFNNLEIIRLNKNLNQKISKLIDKNIQLKFINSTYHESDVNKIKNLNFCKEMFESYCEKNFKYYQTYEFDYRLYNLSI